jgi:pimeloyl-ACP methyl ester carboxylesterase
MPDERKAGLRTMLPNVLHEWNAVIAPSRPLQDWGAIPVPVHILCAADTRHPTRAIASLLTSMHKHWHLYELEGGGHMAPVARPDLVNPIIAEILAELVP